MRFDVIVIGAGPAGSAAAMTARKAGLSVALIDKRCFPRNKLCGGLLTGRSRTHLSNIFGQHTENPLFEPHHEFEFFSRGHSLGHMPKAPLVHLTMRKEFDALLLSHALSAGAEDFTGQRVLDIHFQQNEITLHTGKTLRYHALIGADGVNSQVAKALFGQSFHPKKIGFALETEAPPQIGTRIRLDIAAANWGYGWLFPKHQSTTIGIGGLHAQNSDMKRALHNYFDLLGIRPDTPIKGHFLPFGDDRKRPGKGNVLLVGDAAGFVDPITGEGIGFALQSGQAAAQAAAHGIQQNKANIIFGQYCQSVQPIHTALRCARLIRPLIFSQITQSLFQRSFATSQSVKYDYMNLLAGDLEYPEILGKLIRRLPRSAIRHMVRRPDTAA